MFYDRFFETSKNGYLHETFWEDAVNQIHQYIGGRIRNYRKMKHLTLQQLADIIHKSRATVCKYETGEIALDIGTLYDISVALDVNLSQLTDYHAQQESEPVEDKLGYEGESPFFKADRLYFYFYDGRYERLKTGIIDVHKKILNEDGSYEAVMAIRSTTPGGRSSEIYYNGNVLYSDMLIRFNFVNQYNKLEQDLLYIFNPLELRDYTEGLLCGISSSDLMPCAFKCVVTLTPNEKPEELRSHLLFTTRELRRWQKQNMLLIDNHG